jgi:hypothetical protein
MYVMTGLIRVEIGITGVLRTTRQDSVTVLYACHDWNNTRRDVDKTELLRGKIRLLYCTYVMTGIIRVEIGIKLKQDSVTVLYAGSLSKVSCEHNFKGGNFDLWSRIFFVSRAADIFGEILGCIHHYILGTTGWLDSP